MVVAKGTKGKKRRKGPPDFTEAEWHAYRQGEPLPERLERRRNERLIELMNAFHAPFPRIQDGKVVKSDWAYTIDAINRNVVGRLLLLPDDRWRRVLHALTSPAGRGLVAVGGLAVASKGGRRRTPEKEALLDRLESELSPIKEKPIDTALRIMGSDDREKAKALLAALEWRSNPRHRRKVQPNKR